MFRFAPAKVFTNAATLGSNPLTFSPNSRLKSLPRFPSNPDSDNDGELLPLLFFGVDYYYYYF